MKLLEKALGLRQRDGTMQGSRSEGFNLQSRNRDDPPHHLSHSQHRGACPSARPPVGPHRRSARDPALTLQMTVHGSPGESRRRQLNCSPC